MPSACHHTEDIFMAEINAKRSSQPSKSLRPFRMAKRYRWDPNRWDWNLTIRRYSPNASEPA